MSRSKQPSPLKRLISSILIAQLILAAVPSSARASVYEQHLYEEEQATRSEDEGLGSLEEVLNKVSAWRAFQRKVMRSQENAKALDNLSDAEWVQMYGAEFEKSRKTLIDTLGPESAADAELMELAHIVSRTTNGTLPDSGVMTRLKYWASRIKNMGGKDASAFNETIARLLADYIQNPERRDSITILLGYVAKDMAEPLAQEANGTPLWQSIGYGAFAAMVFVSILHFRYVRVKNPETGEVTLRDWKNWGERLKSDGKAIGSFLKNARRSVPEMIKDLGTTIESNHWSILEVPKNLWIKTKAAAINAITGRTKAALTIEENGLKRVQSELDEAKAKYTQIQEELNAPLRNVTLGETARMKKELDRYAKQVVDLTHQANARQRTVERLRNLYEHSLVMPMSQGQAERAYKMAQARFNTAKADLDNLLKVPSKAQNALAIEEAKLALAEAELAYKNAKEMTSMWSILKRAAATAKNEIPQGALSPLETIREAAKNQDMQSMVSTAKSGGIFPSIESVVENAAASSDEAMMALKSVDQKMRSFARGAKQATVDGLIKNPNMRWSVNTWTFIQVALGSLILGGTLGATWGYQENFVKPLLINPLTALRFIQGLVIGDLEIRIDQFRAKFLQRYDFLDPYMYSVATEAGASDPSGLKSRMDVEKQALLEDKEKARKEFIEFTSEFDALYDELEVLWKDAAFYRGSGIWVNRLNQGLSEDEQNRLKSVTVSEEIDPGKFNKREVDRVFQEREELMTRGFISGSQVLREIVDADWKKIVEMRGLNQCAAAKKAIAFEVSLLREPDPINAQCLKTSGMDRQEAEAIKYALMMPQVSCGANAAQFCSKEQEMTLYIGGDRTVHDCFKRVLCDGVRKDHGQNLDQMVVNLGPLRDAMDSLQKTMLGLTRVMRQYIDLPAPAKRDAQTLVPANQPLN